jgi:hypothetical protein
VNYHVIFRFEFRQGASEVFDRSSVLLVQDRG